MRFDDETAANLKDPAQPYDAVMLVSFGGPDRPQDVLPFLKNVVDGKGVPDERLVEVGHHYDLFGGRSPINGENRQLVADLRTALRAAGSNVPVLWGNRNWHPYTLDTLRTAQAFGARRILAVVTSAYLSYSGSRQYREHLAEAIRDLTSETGSAPQIDILRAYYNDPGFIEANERAIRERIDEAAVGDRVHIAFVTHSIPDTMNEASGATGPTYLEQHRLVAELLAERFGADESLAAPRSWSLSFCSRSGDPRSPWLEPDINDRLDQLHADGIRNVVVAPIGFVSDHMEVVYDLDTEASEHGEKLGMSVWRAGTAGRRPEFTEALAALVLERSAVEGGRQVVRRPVLGAQPAAPDVAPPGSCRQRSGVVTGIPVIAGAQD